MFNLAEFDHVEKFTVYDAIEFLRNERKMSLDITLLVLFCNVLNRRKDTININVYGQVHGGYRYKITDGNKKILDGEWSELESVYSWYNNPDNPNYCNINYEFEDEEIRTLKTYFFDKNELMQFLGLHQAKYNQDKQQENKITEHQNQRIAELEQQLEELKQKLAQATQPPTEEEKQNRISYPQRALFSLLLSKMYPNGDIPNTNALKEGINAELEKIGYREISYNTIDKLLNNK